MTSPRVERMVEVVWTDCQGDAHGWTPIDELDDMPCTVRTVGLLVEPSPRPDHITVALSTYGHVRPGEVPACDSVLHIPKVMVSSLRTLTAEALPVHLSYPHS